MRQAPGVEFDDAMAISEQVDLSVVAEWPARIASAVPTDGEIRLAIAVNGHF